MKLSNLDGLVVLVLTDTVTLEILTDCIRQKGWDTTLITLADHPDELTAVRQEFPGLVILPRDKSRFAPDQSLDGLFIGPQANVDGLGRMVKPGGFARLFDAPLQLAALQKQGFCPTPDSGLLIK